MVEGIHKVRTNVEASFLVRQRSIWQKSLERIRKGVPSAFIKKVAETFVTRVMLMSIGLVTTVMVARILGPEGRGLYAVAIAVGTIGVQFGNLGLHASNTYYVARDKRLLPALVGNTIWISFLFGGLGAFLIYVVFFMNPQWAPVHDLLLILSLLWIPFGLAYMLLQNLLLGIQEVRAYNKIELATKVFGVGFMVLAIVIGAANVETFFLAGLIALVISFFWAFYRLQSHLAGPPLPSLALFKENISYGLKAYLAAFFAFLLLRVDLLMVQYMLGAEQSGYYSISVAMADMIYMLPIVIGTILFPELSGIPTRREKWMLAKAIALILGPVMMVLTGCAVLLADWVVQLFFGEVFLPSVPAFKWLMPGIVMLSVNTVYMNYFASVGMPFIAILSPGVALIFNIALNFKLIPWLGIVGASIASTLSYGLMLVASITYVSCFRK
jgi:O-antigen/teichoic acid export membrane protein